MKDDWIYKRGDLYYANLNPYFGSEQGGTRPVPVSYTHLKSRKRRNGRPSWACPPSGITQTLWKLGLLRNPQTALSVTAVVRPHTSTIQYLFSVINS